MAWVSHWKVRPRAARCQRAPAHAAERASVGTLPPSLASVHRHPAAKAERASRTSLRVFPYLTPHTSPSPVAGDRVDRVENQKVQGI